MPRRDVEIILHRLRTKHTYLTHCFLFSSSSLRIVYRPIENIGFYREIWVCTWSAFSSSNCSVSLPFAYYLLTLVIYSSWHNEPKKTATIETGVGKPCFHGSNYLSRKSVSPARSTAQQSVEVYLCGLHYWGNMHTHTHTHTHTKPISLIASTVRIETTD